MSRYSRPAVFAAVLLATHAATLACSAQTRPPNPVFAYELGDKSPAEQARLIHEAGFDGTVFDGAKDVPARLAALDREHVQLFFLWITVDVSNGRITFEPGMENSIRALKGRGTLVSLAIKGSGPNAGQLAVQAVQQVCDLASASNLRVALYPHHAFFMPTLRDALRIADQAKRSNLGVTFNLCHELRAGWDSGMDALLAQAMPRLFVATINGADREGRDWKTLIQPLGHGNFDVRALVQRLLSMGYRGPIGVQCYGIQQDSQTLLAETRRNWLALSNGLGGAENALPLR